MRIEVNSLLTIKEAAEYLDSSESYVERLLISGKLPLLHMNYLEKYKQQKDTTRKALKELTQMSEDMGGYEEMNPKPNPLPLV